MINLRKSTERALQNSPFGHKRSLVGVIVLAIFKTKLLQKSEMRKDIVIELSYKGFS